MPSEDFSTTVVSGQAAPAEDTGMPAAAEAPEAKVGAQLGPWRLERLIGEGSMGQVFEARHVRLGRAAALKVLRGKYARDDAFVQRFFREAQSVNRINHEHIVEISDFVDEREAGRVYCVMELLHGESLAQRLRRGSLTLTEVQRLGVQLCTALEAAHRVGVVHRDVKPDNIFLCERGGQADFVKVLDFGVAKQLSGADVPGGTLDGTLIGTPAYMAPEQAAGLPVDHRADIHAVGAVLFELLTGRPPFDSTAFGPLVVQVITQPAPALPVRLASGEPMPPGLARLVARCLEKAPEARPQSLAEVTTGLLTLGRSEAERLPWPLKALARRYPQLTRVRLTRRRAAWAAGSGAAALVAAVALLAFRPVEATAGGAAPGEAPAVNAVVPAFLLPSVSVSVGSFPEGARVVRTDTGAELGTTPLTLSLPRSDTPLVLRLERPGYAPIERTVALTGEPQEVVAGLIKARPGGGTTVPARATVPARDVPTPARPLAAPLRAGDRLGIPQGRSARR